MKPLTITKTVVEAKSRPLKATWTSEVVQEDPYIDISDEIAKILQQEIDKEIMIEILVSQGWIRVVIDKTKTVNKEWCETCIKKQYKSLDNIWFFEDQNDANMFALAWLS